MKVAETLRFRYDPALADALVDEDVATPASVAAVCFTPVLTFSRVIFNAGNHGAARAGNSAEYGRSLILSSRGKNMV